MKKKEENVIPKKEKTALMQQANRRVQTAEGKHRAHLRQLRDSKEKAA
jgi:hypothetical protein